jgi:hypothetical protein
MWKISYFGQAGNKHAKEKPFAEETIFGDFAMFYYFFYP